MTDSQTALLGTAAYLREARKAKWLSWASLAYMALEGIVAVVAGILWATIRTEASKPVQAPTAP